MEAVWLPPALMTGKSGTGRVNFPPLMAGETGNGGVIIPLTGKTGVGGAKIPVVVAGKTGIGGVTIGGGQVIGGKSSSMEAVPPPAPAREWYPRLSKARRADPHRPGPLQPQEGPAARREHLARDQSRDRETWLLYEHQESLKR